MEDFTAKFYELCLVVKLVDPLILLVVFIRTALRRNGKEREVMATRFYGRLRYFQF